MLEGVLTSMLRTQALLLLPVLALAQDATEPVFRSRTQLVQMDVVVKANNAPAAGLRQTDFQVFDNGKPQQIAIFSVRNAQPGNARWEPLPPGVVSNRPRSRGPEPVSATVVLIDAQNTPVEDQGYARLQALKYLDNASRNETVGLYSLDTTLHVLQEFTDDRATLRKAVDGFHMSQSLNLQDGQFGLLAGLTGNAANAMRAANLQRQADITTAAFEAIAHHLQGLPGRKKLIWISAALPLTFTQDNERNGATMTEFTNLSPEIFAPMKLLNDANVAIYPIDPRGVIVGLMDPNLATMNQLAQRTGGKAIYADNGVAASIEAAFADTDLTYTLGFYPTEESTDGRVHALSVKVNLPNADVRYRQSYLAEGQGKAPTEKVRKATLSAWVNEPLGATFIGIQAAAVPSIGKPGYYDVEVSIDPADLKLEPKNGRFVGSFDLAIVPDVANRPKGLQQTIKVDLTEARLQIALSKGILIVNQIRVTNAKGKLLSDKLHLVVMDNATGRAGSVRLSLHKP